MIRGTFDILSTLHGGSTGTKFGTSGKKSKIEISQKYIFYVRKLETAENLRKP
jgi:hypothetical protein